MTATKVHAAVNVAFSAPRALVERLDAEVMRMKRAKPFVGCTRSALVRLAINDMFDRFDHDRAAATTARRRTREPDMVERRQRGTT